MANNEVPNNAKPSPEFLHAASAGRIAEEADLLLFLDTEKPLPGHQHLTISPHGDTAAKAPADAATGGQTGQVSFNGKFDVAIQEDGKDPDKYLAQVTSSGDFATHNMSSSIKRLTSDTGETVSELNSSNAGGLFHAAYTDASGNQLLASDGLWNPGNKSGMALTDGNGNIVAMAVLDFKELPDGSDGRLVTTTLFSPDQDHRPLGTMVAQKRFNKETGSLVEDINLTRP